MTTSYDDGDDVDLAYNEILRLLSCSNIEDRPIMRIRNRRFLQKSCALDNIVCVLYRHQAETELVSLETQTQVRTVVFVFIMFIFTCAC